MDRIPKKLRSPLGVAGSSTAALITLALAAAVAPAEAKEPFIRGSLDRPGAVIARGGGKTRSVATGRRFKLRPPARIVIIRVRDRGGKNLGPLVVGRRDGRAIVGVRAGTRIGLVRARRGYLVPVRRLPSRSIAKARTITLPASARGASTENGTAGVARDGGGLAAAEPITAGAGEDELLGTERDRLALIVGVAAALLALASLGFHLAGWLRSRRKRVEVEVRLGLPLYEEGTGQWAVFIEVFNRTDHPVRWTSAALELKDGRRAYVIDYPTGGELPAVIQPHESHETWVECRRLERSGFYLDQPVVAAVKTDNGEVYRSKRRKFRRTPRAT